MSNGRNDGRVSGAVSFLIGLILTIVPLGHNIDPYRPDWIALLVIFWALQLPRTWSVGSAWIAGIVLDVAQGTLLGQHALALCVITFIMIRFHLQIRVFPLSQLTATVFAMLALYQFLLFWINGVDGNDAPMVYYWGPVISGTLLWPFVHSMLSGYRYRTRPGG